MAGIAQGSNRPCQPVNVKGQLSGGIVCAGTRLTDSTIVDMKLHMPHCQDPAKREFTQLLEVSLAYRKIEWEHVKSGTSGADDWRAPLEA